jgi:aminoglycoside phosphotransferase (APT) family kinase protein
VIRELRKFLRRALGRDGRPKIEGPPPGLDLNELEALCQKEWGTGVASLTHSHLSAWKETGSYAVHVQGENGESWNLIFKRADYALQEIPALQGFPLRPGPPEYLVMAATGAVAEFLPRVYQASEPRAGEQFLYFVEDLSDRFRVAAPADCVRCAEFLPELQEALSADFAEDENPAFLHFDDQFWNDLLVYAEGSLRAFAPEHPDSGASALADLLPALNELRSIVLGDSAAPRDDASLVPIHGDYNSSNIMVAKQGDGIKALDWEWCGFGLVHADLASLLKGLDAKTEAAALAAFAERMPQLSFERHQELYRWCQIERGVMDASYLAKQALGSDHAASLQLPSWVKSSHDLVVRYREELLR